MSVVSKTTCSIFVCQKPNSSNKVRDFNLQIVNKASDRLDTDGHQ